MKAGARAPTAERCSRSVQRQRGAKIAVSQKGATARLLSTKESFHEVTSD